MTAAAEFFKLREDLELLPAGTEADGSQSHLLHNPLGSTFDRMEWPEYEIVSRLRSRTDAARLHARLTGETTVRITRGELEEFIADLRARGFLNDGKVRPVDELMARWRSGRSGAARWLLGHYLYFRVPLLRPDAFLGRTLWVPRLLGSFPLRMAFWLCLAAAAYLFLTRAELFFQSAVRFLSWKNAALMSLAVIAVKTAHEFSHAYAGKLRGARIAAMGLVFMVMFPLPYCDVTDSWRLPRRDRLAISAAGMRTELAIAVLAFIGWACSPTGTARDIFLVLCSGTLASTLLTNLNPGMRFDGYYLFSDLLGVDNLQERAFAYFRRTYRRLFFGLILPEPETRLSGRQKALMLVYTAYAWLYRMFLYFGIAVTVYLYFPKAIGIALFAVEFAMFLVRPAVNELKSLWRMRRYPRRAFRTALTGAVLAGLAFWLAVPLPRRIALPAAGVGRRTAPLYAPWNGEVVDYRLQRGGRVAAGDVVLALETRFVDLELRRVEGELDEARTLLRFASGDGALRENLLRAAAGEKRLLSARAALRARLAGNRLTAPFDGVILDVDETVRPGLSIAKGRYMGLLADTAAGVKIVAYVPEKYREDVQAGTAAWFVPDSRPGTRFECAVERVAPVNSSVVEEPYLAERHGGSMVTEGRGRSALRPAETAYRLEAGPLSDGGDVRFGQVGTLYVESRPRSLAADALRRIVTVLVRESGF